MNLSTVGCVFEEVAARLNETYTDEETRYRTWVNLCTYDIATSFPNAPFNYVSADRTLSANTRQYTNLPTDFDRMINVVYPGGDIKLTYLTTEEFNAVQPSATETGSPTVYTLHGATNPANTQIEFYPVPSTDLTVNYEYRKLPTTVSSFSTVMTTIVPPKYNELYVLFTQMQGLRRREEHAAADKIEVRYEVKKQQMISNFSRMVEEPMRIKSVREFTSSNKTYGDEIVNMFWGQD